MNENNDNTLLLETQLIHFRGRRVVLLTGGTGYLGSLIVQILLCQSNLTLVILVREGHNLKSFFQSLQKELVLKNKKLAERDLKRITFIKLPPFDQFNNLNTQLKTFRIDEIIHCAGCLDYFDIFQLEQTNVIFTQYLIELAISLQVRRFVYLSTIYSCGYTNGIVKEVLHEIPSTDPTEYTRTKREAEWLIARSGIPFLIIRPSIVIGDSNTGHYSGKRYGLYQQWMGMERLLCNSYHTEIHTVAPHQPLHLIHQDSFQTAFYHAYTTLPDNTIIHLTSSEGTAPTMRELFDLWMSEVLRPQKIFYYESLEDIPLTCLHPRQRAYLKFAQINLKLGSHNWTFETTHLEQLRVQGLEFKDATLETVATCQQRFIESSPNLQKFLVEIRRVSGLPQRREMRRK